MLTGYWLTTGLVAVTGAAAVWAAWRNRRFGVMVWLMLPGLAVAHALGPGTCDDIFCVRTAVRLEVTTEAYRTFPGNHTGERSRGVETCGSHHGTFVESSWPAKAGLLVLSFVFLPVFLWNLLGNQMGAALGGGLMTGYFDPVGMALFVVLSLLVTGILAFAGVATVKERLQGASRLPLRQTILSMEAMEVAFLAVALPTVAGLVAILISYNTNHADVAVFVSQSLLSFVTCVAVVSVPFLIDV